MSATASSVEADTRPGLDTLLREIEALEVVIAGWDDEQHRHTVEAHKRAVDALHKEAMARLIRSLKTEPAAMAGLKAAVTDEVVYAVLRHLELVKPSLHERVEAALDSVRPYLASHGGDVELVGITPPDTVEIRLKGACDGCPAAGLTLSEGVEKAIKEYCPEIKTIKKARGGASAQPVNGVTVDFVSPFANAADAGWIYAARLDEIPEFDIKPMDVGGQPVLLSRFGDTVTCYQNACAHMGMSMDMGEVSKGILTCPHHGFQYSMPSGACLAASEVQLQAHAVRIVGDTVEVKLS